MRFGLCAALIAAALVVVACGRDDNDASLGGGGPGGLPTADASDPIPKNVPQDGLIYTGLERGEDGGPCEGLYEIVEKPGVPEEQGCSHGPDEAPPQVADVRTDAPLGELRSRDEPPPPAAENAKPGELADEAPSAASTADAVPCIGSGSDGQRVQAIYAHVAGQPDRYDQLKSSIIDWAAQASGVFNSSAAKNGAVRKLRFVTDSGSPGCKVVVQNVALPADADDDFSKTITAMRTAGFAAPSRRYLVWMDANRLCGVGQISTDSRPGQENENNGMGTTKGAISRVDEQCWGRLTNGGISVEAHELVHNMGGVQNDAPNGSGGFHCTDESDTLCYTDTPNNPPMRQICPTASETFLDCGENDYFNAGTASGYLSNHWNVANSSFLYKDALGAPANDSFGNPIKLAGGSINRVGDYNQGSEHENAEPNHGAPGRPSVWYTWTAPGNGNVTFSTAGSSFDTTVGVYTGGALANLTQVAQNNDGGGGSQSRVSFPATAGTQYRFAVDGVNEAVGAIYLSLSLQEEAKPAQPKKGSGGGKKKKKKKKPKKKK